ncbi:MULTISPECIES: DMT family transporter [unclassified Acidisoma]|jgi:drug/metabolite transporter (DMT)-like permease|uniref:DMT family transporter n=1 Tax=unclassified Acidisoma TaxID=2634065 RepID=UPI00131BC065|nr:MULTISPECIES: DMT family transporter [unclassified Acidisoma]
MRALFDRLARPGAARAILLVLASTLLYAVGYAITKTLIDTWHYGAVQLFVLRSVISLALVMGIGMARRNLRVSPSRLLRPPQAWAQRFAAAALVLSSVLAFLAYGLLPMTIASAFGFTAPLLVTGLGGLVLRERVPALRWVAVAIGFLGMLLIVRPRGGAHLHWLGIAASLGAALTYAIYQILIRRLKDAATTADAVAQAALVGIVLLGVPMLLLWRPIGPLAALLILAATLGQTAGLATIAAAIRQGQVSQLAPWQYSGILWSVLLDATLFGHLPHGLALAGIALIIAGGLMARSGKAAS